MRLLYVEDNRINALLFEEALKLQPGFELRVAEDGAQAEELARDWQPEVLVLDSHLPDVNGAALLQRLRQLPGLASVPAFMCSADAQQEDVQQALAAGFRGYWAKPISIVSVLSDLQALLPPG
ncbi:response regulator [Ideonella sp. BN130291]|uniref:response regulator n=1 Tax=Ideonella sp. BN130291 TaxID=3112940 RepID=UPI002E26EC26|nr:response regulator [Ideonella sp. BN130291]